MLLQLGHFITFSCKQTKKRFNVNKEDELPPPKKNKNNNAGDEHSPENLLLKTELKRFGWFFGVQWAKLGNCRFL